MVRLLVIVALLATQVAFAADTVDDICANNEGEGGVCDYTSVAAWETGTSVSCASGGFIGNVWASAGPTTTQTTIAGASNLSATNHRKLRGAPSELTAANSGTFTTSGRHYFNIPTTVQYGLFMQEDYFEVENLQIKITQTDGTLCMAIRNYNDYVKIYGNIIWADFTSAGNVSAGIHCGNQKVSVINNIIYGFNPIDDVIGYGIRAAAAVTGSDGYIANNTVTNCHIGIGTNSDLGTGNHLYNNISSGNDDNYLVTGTIGTSTHNLSSSGDAPGTSAINGTPAFKIGSYHLDSSDTAAKDAGMDFSSVLSWVTTDIDGYTRPYNSTWDVGADEYVTEATPTPTVTNTPTNTPTPTPTSTPTPTPTFTPTPTPTFTPTPSPTPTPYAVRPWDSGGRQRWNGGAWRIR